LETIKKENVNDCSSTSIICLIIIKSMIFTVKINTPTMKIKLEKEKQTTLGLYLKLNEA